MPKSKKKYGERTNARDWADKQAAGFESTSITLPDGMSWFSPRKEGTYRIDIAEYIAGDGNPNAKEGDRHFERTFFTHRGLGSSGKDSYICLDQTFGKSCPVCKERARLDRERADKKVLAGLSPKRRQLFLVHDLTDEDEAEKGWQLWDISYHLFGKKLQAVLRSADDEDDYDKFSFLDDGLTLKVTFEEKSIEGSNPFLEASVIEFKKRKEQYDESEIDDLPCLDDLIIETPFADLKKILNQEQDEDDEDEPRRNGKSKSKKRKDDEDEDEDDDPKSKKRRSRDDDEDEDDETKSKKGKMTEDDDDDDDDEEEGPTAKELGIKVGSKIKHKEHGVCTVKHVSGDGTSLRLEDEDGDLHRAIASWECKPVKKKKEDDEDEDEDEDDRLRSRRHKPSRNGDDDDDDEDEVPRKKKKSKSKDVAFGDDDDDD